MGDSLLAQKFQCCIDDSTHKEEREVRTWETGTELILTPGVIVLCMIILICFTWQDIVGHDYWIDNDNKTANLLHLRLI